MFADIKNRLNLSEILLHQRKKGISADELQHFCNEIVCRDTVVSRAAFEAMCASADIPVAWNAQGYLGLMFKEPADRETIVSWLLVELFSEVVDGVGTISGIL